MAVVRSEYTDGINFFESSDPHYLIERFGSPLYVYNERILRERCREMRSLVNVPDFRVSYSSKANSNIELLKIVREEGLHVDAMSTGEIFILMQAGFKPEEIFFISNNVSAEEMRFAVERNVIVSVDSISQLAMYGQLNPGGLVAVRINPGLGAGHHDKVITGGMATKFGVAMTDVDKVKKYLDEYNLTVCGINQHIGSFFLEPDIYLDTVQRLLAVAENFETLEFIDFGGGFGIPYRKYNKEQRMNLKAFGSEFERIISEWRKKTGWEGVFQIEPGRYVAAECGILLGTAHAVKELYGTKYIGTDLGFNVMSRPVIYDAYHEIEVYRKHSKPSMKSEKVSIVGNICETGDIMAGDRILPEIYDGDLIAVLDCGAYGYSMCSNYNLRLRPAEVLLRLDGSIKLIRRRDTHDDLLGNYT